MATFSNNIIQCLDLRHPWSSEYFNGFSIQGDSDTIIKNFILESSKVIESPFSIEIPAFIPINSILLRDISTGNNLHYYIPFNNNSITITSITGFYRYFKARPFQYPIRQTCFTKLKVNHNFYYILPYCILNSEFKPLFIAYRTLENISQYKTDDSRIVQYDGFRFSHYDFLPLKCNIYIDKSVFDDITTLLNKFIISKIIPYYSMMRDNYNIIIKNNDKLFPEVSCNLTQNELNNKIISLLNEQN